MKYYFTNKSCSIFSLGTGWKKAFTVLEMVVVISIITILFSIFMVNFREVDTTQLLETETEKILSVLKEAQIYSLAGQTSSGVRYNYGVRLSSCVSGSCSYILYGDSSTDGYDVGEENNSGRTMNILTGIYVSSVLPEVSGNLDITFEAPLSEIYFNGAQAVEEASIVLTNSSGSTKTITINRLSGKIEAN
jgi:prepilin-type N-terminal cleavage/methylation domain-containing protein